LFVVSLVKSKEKTFDAMKKSKSMMGGMIGEIVAIIFLIGLVLTFIPPETMKTENVLVTFEVDGVSMEEIRQDLLTLSIETLAGGKAKVTDVKLVTVVDKKIKH
jgi:signal peptidase I